MSDLVNVTGTYHLSGNDIMPEVEEHILSEELDWAPMSTFLVAVNGTIQIEAPDFRWPEMTFDKFSVTVTTGIANASAGAEQTVTLSVGNATVGDIIHHSPSRQKFQVTEWISKTSSTSTVKITRIPISQAAVAVSGTPSCIVLSNQIPEGGYYPIGKAATPTWYTNYTQICTDTTSITETMKKTRTYYEGGQWNLQLQDLTIRHRRNMERNFWWGEGMSEERTLENERGQSWTGQFRMSQGFEDRLQSHLTTYSGTLTKSTFNNWLRNHVFNSRNSGSRAKMLVCGPGVLNALADIVEDNIQVQQGANEFGLDIQKWIYPGGRTLAIMEEREFMDNDEYTDTCFAVEPNVIDAMQFGEHYIESFNIEPNDQDIDSIVIRSENGWRVRKEHMSAKLSKLS